MPGGLYDDDDDSDEQVIWRCSPVASRLKKLQEKHRNHSGLPVPLVPPSPVNNNTTHPRHGSGSASSSSSSSLTLSQRLALKSSRRRPSSQHPPYSSSSISSSSSSLSSYPSANARKKMKLDLDQSRNSGTPQTPQASSSSKNKTNHSGFEDFTPPMARSKYNTHSSNHRHINKSTFGGNKHGNKYSGKNGGKIGGKLYQYRSGSTGERGDRQHSHSHSSSRQRLHKQRRIDSLQVDDLLNTLSLDSPLPTPAQTAPTHPSNRSSVSLSDPSTPVSVVNTNTEDETSNPNKPSPVVNNPNNDTNRKHDKQSIQESEREGGREVTETPRTKARQDRIKALTADLALDNLSLEGMFDDDFQFQPPSHSDNPDNLLIPSSSSSSSVSCQPNFSAKNHNNNPNLPRKSSIPVPSHNPSNPSNPSKAGSGLGGAGKYVNRKRERERERESRRVVVNEGRDSDRYIRLKVIQVTPDNRKRNKVSLIALITLIALIALLNPYSSL